MLLYFESQSLRFTKQPFVYFYGGYQGSLYVPHSTSECCARPPKYYLYIFQQIIDEPLYVPDLAGRRAGRRGRGGVVSWLIRPNAKAN